MLIVVTGGFAPNAGYSLRVTRITDNGRRWRVLVTVRAPGDNCVLPAVVAWPYHVVRVRRSTKPVVVSRKVTVYDC
jgi:hypothetical protein